MNRKRRTEFNIFWPTIEMEMELWWSTCRYLNLPNDEPLRFYWIGIPFALYKNNCSIYQPIKSGEAAILKCKSNKDMWNAHCSWNISGRWQVCCRVHGTEVVRCFATHAQDIWQRNRMKKETFSMVISTKIRSTQLFLVFCFLRTKMSRQHTAASIVSQCIKTEQQQKTHHTHFFGLCAPCAYVIIFNQQLLRCSHAFHKSTDGKRTENAVGNLLLCVAEVRRMTTAPKMLSKKMLSAQSIACVVYFHSAVMKVSERNMSYSIRGATEKEVCGQQPTTSTANLAWVDDDDDNERYSCHFRNDRRNQNEKNRHGEMAAGRVTSKPHTKPHWVPCAQKML